MMQGESGNASGNDVRAGLNLAASRNPPPVELAHVFVPGLEFPAIFRRQFFNPRHAVVARRKVLDLTMPGENAVADVARKVGEIDVAVRGIVLKLSMQGAEAHGAPLGSNE